MIKSHQVTDTLDRYAGFGPITHQVNCNGEAGMTLEQIAHLTEIPLETLEPYVNGYVGDDYPYRYWLLDGQAVKVVSLVEALSLIVPSLEELKSILQAAPDTTPETPVSVIEAPVESPVTHLEPKDNSPLTLNPNVNRTRKNALRDQIEALINERGESLDGITTADWVALLSSQGYKTTASTVIKHLKNLCGNKDYEGDYGYLVPGVGNYAIGSADVNRDCIATDGYPQKYEYFFT